MSLALNITTRSMQIHILFLLQLPAPATLLAGAVRSEKKHGFYVPGKAALMVVLLGFCTLLGQQQATAATVVAHRASQRSYEYANQLGNVLAVVSDKKQLDGTGSTNQSAQPSIVAVTDYFPFGSPLLARAQQSRGYRYGLNGQELDPELKGRGNSYNFGARMQDPRLGRWLSIDPLAKRYPSHAPYCFVGNMPIAAIDPDGKRIKIVNNDANVRQQLFNDLQKLSRVQLVLLKNGEVIKARKLRKHPGESVEFTGSVSETLNSDGKVVRKRHGTRLVNKAIRNKHTVEIHNVSDAPGAPTNNNTKVVSDEEDDLETDHYDPKRNKHLPFELTGSGADATVYYDPASRREDISNADGTKGRAPQIGLGHELWHALRIMKGKVLEEVVDVDNMDSDKDWMLLEELTIRVLEQHLRKEQNQPPRYIPTIKTSSN